MANARYTYTEKSRKMPNFLESEVGLVLKTWKFDTTTAVTTEDRTKYVPAGTVYPTNDASAKGIVFEDVDVTHGEAIGSLIIAGRIYKNRLPKTIDSGAETPLSAQGLYWSDAPETTRDEE